MKKLTKKEKETLQSIANQIKGNVNYGLAFDLSPKEYKLLRKLAMWYEVDRYAFILDWKDCFEEMSDEDANYTLYYLFKGLNYKIEQKWLDAGDLES
jgi:hypothetical protein